MAYTNINYQTKKALKGAVARGVAVRVINTMTGEEMTNCKVAIEGPHYPQPHTWYALVEVSVDGVITKVK